MLTRVLLGITATVVVSAGVLAILSTRTQNTCAGSVLTDHELSLVYGGAVEGIGRAQDTPDTTSCFGADGCSECSQTDDGQDPPGCTGDGILYLNNTIKQTKPANNGSDEHNVGKDCWLKTTCVPAAVALDSWCGVEALNKCEGGHEGMRCKKCEFGALLEQGVKTDSTAQDP